MKNAIPTFIVSLVLPSPAHSTFLKAPATGAESEALATRPGRVTALVVSYAAAGFACTTTRSIVKVTMV